VIVHETLEANLMQLMWNVALVQQKHRKERQEEQQHLANMTAIVRSFQEVNNQPGNRKATTATDTTMITSSSQQGSGACDCSVCFEEMNSGNNNNNNNNTTAGSSRGSLPHVDSSSSAKKRACFRPCNHATVCLDCAVRIWINTKTCPMCKAKLTTKPEAIYL
jgi:hypothetical protein